MLWTESSNVCFPDQYFDYSQSFHVIHGSIKIIFTYTNIINILTKGEIIQIPATTPFSLITGSHGAIFEIKIH